MSYSHTETIRQTIERAGHKVTQVMGSQDVAHNGGVIATRYYPTPIEVEHARRDHAAPR